MRVSAVFKSMHQGTRGGRKIKTAADKTTLEVFLFAAVKAQRAAVLKRQPAAPADKACNGLKFFHATRTKRI